MRFARALILSCAFALAASAIAAVIAPRRVGKDAPAFLPPSGATVIYYTLNSALVVLVLHTPILLGLRWATRDRLKLSRWVWGALGFTIPLVAQLASAMADRLWQLQYGFSIWQITATILDAEAIVFGALMPAMIAGGAFGWLLFEPEATPREPDPSAQ